MLPKILNPRYCISEFYKDCVNREKFIKIIKYKIDLIRSYMLMFHI